MSKPDFLLNARQMADALGISTNAFAKWGVEPDRRVGRETLYRVGDVVDNRVADALKKNAVKAPAPLEGGDELVDPILEKALLDRERRRGQEIKNETALGEVFPTEIAEAVFARVGAEMAAVLETLPGKIKALRPELTAGELSEITREIARARNTAADVAEVFDDAIAEYFAETTH